MPHDSGAMLSVDAVEAGNSEGGSGRDGMAGGSAETGEGHFERDALDPKGNIRREGGSGG